jgi:hypothetical protein
LAVVGCSLVANGAGATPFATAQSDGAAGPGTAITVAAVAFAVELAFSAVALALIERRRTADVLKGEF